MIKFRAILGRRYLLLVVAVLLGVAAGLVSSSLAPKNVASVYVAEQVLVANSNSGASSNIAQDALKVTRGAVPGSAATILGRPGQGEALASVVDATAAPETNSITISSQSANPVEGKRVVDAFAKAFLQITNADLLKDQQRKLGELQKSVDTATSQLSAFDSANPQAATLDAAVSTDPRIKALAEQRGNIIQVQQQAQQTLVQAQLSTSESLPYSALGTPTASPAKSSLLNVPTSPTLRAGLLGFLGLLLGIGLVLIIERAKQRIDTREELAEAIGVPIISEVGYLPRSKRTRHGDGRLRLEGVWAEPYRRVRAAIQFVQAQPPPPGGRQPRVFLITSAQPGEGKSTSTALTALALAEVDIPTVVVGGDFRRPAVELLLGGSGSPTLQDFAQMTLDRPTVDEVVRSTPEPSLWVAPSGPSTREVATLTNATKDLVQECVARGATVIIDSSPLQAANDTVDLLSVVDEVILIVRSGDATAAGLTDSVDLLRRHNAHLLGVVLVGTPGVGRLQTYYDSYYMHAKEEQAAPTGPSLIGGPVSTNGAGASEPKSVVSVPTNHD